MCKIKNYLFFLLLFCDYSRSVSATDIAVLLNSNNAVSSLSLKDLNRIFTGTKKYWENGEQVVIFLPKVGSVSLDALSGKVFKKSDSSAVAKFYLKAIFQQKFAAIPNVSTDPVMDVGETQGGIMIVDINKIDADSNVKILKVVGLSQ